MSLILYLILCSLSSLYASKPQPVVLLVSLDGFRYDYMEKHKDSVPNLRHLASQGTQVEYVKNVYPTVTFPNHYSIVTGLYPESHGIVDNNMYDPVFDEHFNMSTTDPKWWEDAEPIWVTNQKQGYPSGMCYWPGYDVKIKGYLAHYRPLNASFNKPFVTDENVLPWPDRVDMVVGWLNQTKDIPSFVTLYFEEPDEVGHRYGADAIETAKKLQEVDKTIGYLMEQLKKLTIYPQVNIIITSDHGMMNYYANTVINIDDYVNPDKYVMWSSAGTEFQFTNSSLSTLDELYKDFKKMEKGTKGKIKIYKKSEIPDRLHFRNNRRIADLAGFVQGGYYINASGYTNFTMRDNETRGTHGYDPINAEMHPFLIAFGPAFKQHYKSGPIDMLDIYSLMCHIIGIHPRPNNGSLSRIDHLLKGSLLAYLHSVSRTVSIVIGFVILVLLCTLTCVFLIRKKLKGKSPSVLFRNQRSEWDYPLMGTEGDEDEIVIF